MKSGEAREPYTAPVDRNNPTCYLFLIDQSKSMRLEFRERPDKTKAQGVAEEVNRILHKIVLQCCKGNNIYYDYFYVGVIGYGRRVGLALGGQLAGQGLVPISEIATKPLRVETRIKEEPDEQGGVVKLTSKFPVWFDAESDGRTPMCEALRQAKITVEDFVQAYPASFPPIVINITDGAATDGDPEPCAAELRNVASEDGNVLLFNAHISSSDAVPVQYPVSESEVPDDKFAPVLFRMSSPLPQKMLDEAPEMQLSLRQGARGFAFNANLASITNLINIGTIKNPSNR